MRLLRSSWTVGRGLLEVGHRGADAQPPAPGANKPRGALRDGHPRQARVNPPAARCTLGLPGCVQIAYLRLMREPLRVAGRSSRPLPGRALQESPP